MTLVYLGEFKRLGLALFYQPPTYKPVRWLEIVQALERGETVTLRPANETERAWAREQAGRRAA